MRFAIAWFAGALAIGRMSAKAQTIEDLRELSIDDLSQVSVSSVSKTDQPLGDADAVEVAVQDEGTGMAPEVAEKAFEPFFTTKDKGRGTGLGLSQVYGFARASQGEVSISSAAGVGTTVTILVPRSTRSAATPSRTSATSAPRRLGGLSVLLVEDDPVLNELVGEMLEELGSRVDRASSAAEGLKMFGEAPVDVVVSDMVIPGGMDGLDLARQLRERRADLPIVLMTGFSEVAGSASKEGFSVLRKPFPIEAMADSLVASRGGEERT